MKKNHDRCLDGNAPELEIEGVVRDSFFADFDCTRRIGNIDFCAAVRAGSAGDRQSVVWAERKRGEDSLDDALVQLILTIGRARTFERELPPPFLAAFNAVRMAFIPYESVMDVFSANDFNWNVAPSDHSTREFAELRSRVSAILAGEKRTFDFVRDARELRRFIVSLKRKPSARIQITKTNFTHIYYKWRDDVMPTIDMIDWEKAKKSNIIDADFYLADILSTDNRTDGIYEKLRVLLEDDHYRQRAGVDNLNGELYREFRFKDAQKAHRQFRNRYRRPPRREYWNYIIERRDLLVPQDVRETKGAFFTPREWVSLSQDYLASELGDNWQERYVVWDCCAGTGNLLAGLTSPRNVWASTLDGADVAVMRQRIANGANLFENHVFQFDFLNDPFDMLPDADVYERNGVFVGKKNIEPDDGARLVNDWAETFVDKIAEKDKKSSFGTLLAVANDFQHQNTVNITMPYKPWNHQFQWQVSAANVVESCVYFAVRLNIEATWLNDRDQFLFPNAGWTCDGAFKGDCLVYALFHGQNRISATEGVNHWIPFSEREVGCHRGFKSHFMSDLLAGKTSRAALRQSEFSYDDRAEREARLAYYHAQELGRTWYDVSRPETILAMDPVIVDSVDEAADRHAAKDVFRRMAPVVNSADGRAVVFPVTAAKKLTRSTEINVFGLASEFGRIFAASLRAWSETAADIPEHREHRNVVAYHHYIARVCWKDSDLLVRFTVREGACGTGDNEVHGTTVSGISVYKTDGASMSDPSRSQGEALAPFVDSKIALFLSVVKGGELRLTESARAVLDAGRDLWRYYHEQSGADPDASFYDIRRHFQGVDEKGRMNAASTDVKYGTILSAIKTSMKALAKEITPKIYDYGFLRQNT